MLQGDAASLGTVRAPKCLLGSNLISLEFVGQKWLQTLAVLIKIVIKGNIAAIKFIPRVFFATH